MEKCFSLLTPPFAFTALNSYHSTSAAGYIFVLTQTLGELAQAFWGLAQVSPEQAESSPPVFHKDLLFPHRNNLKCLVAKRGHHSPVLHASSQKQIQI